jgi:pilus assembly protein Flp/PilA
MVYDPVTRRQFLFGRPAATGLARDERGATVIEYGLIGALVAIAAMPALSALGTSTRSMFTCMKQGLDRKMNAYCKARSKPRATPKKK